MGVAIKKGGGSECELAGAELKSTFTTLHFVVENV